MLLIEGSRTAKIRSYPHIYDKCRACNRLDLRVDVFQDYFHVFWIPVFPVSKKSAKVVCSHCGASHPDAGIGHDYRQRTNTPVYLFSGLILLLVFIIWIISLSK